MYKNTLFGMINTAKSQHYTDLALKSFFATAELSDNDHVILIDNDNTWDDNTYFKLTIIKNSEPKSFSSNINQLIKIADNLNLDLVIINNDVICTSNWRTHLEKRDDIICLPSCNQTHVYVDENKNPVFSQTVNLENYRGNWQLLQNIANVHKQNNRGYYERIETPFYFFRLPKEIYRKVGFFDENFKPAGGEDLDYRIRSLKEGYKTLYTNDSYVLHFHGKSTWDGAETAEQIAKRNQGYFDIFAEKYGIDAANLLCKVNQPAERISEIVNKYNLNNSDSFTNIIEKLFNLILEVKSQVPQDQISAAGLLNYINDLGDNIVGCELGVCMGFTLRYFLDSNKRIKKVYAIDSWKSYMDHWGEVKQELANRWKDFALNLLEPYKDRIQILEMDSFEASSFIKNSELDYIFIDGDHSYAAVAQDLRRYWTKVRPGGIFAGHDWQLDTVRLAVEDFRKEYNINTEIKFTETNVWFWYKEKDQ